MRTLLTALTLSALASCSDVTRSAYLDTAGFYAVYSVVADDDAPVRLSAVFRARDAQGAFLSLGDGDAVTCDGAALAPGEITESAAEPFATLGYRAEGDARQNHTFALTRTGEGPYTTEVATPTPLAPALDITDGAFASQFTLRWSGGPSTAAVRIDARSADAGCVSTTLATGLIDPGYFIVRGSSLAPGTSHPTPCRFTLTVVRTRETPVGAPFHGGALRSVSVGRVALRLR